MTTSGLNRIEHAAYIEDRKKVAEEAVAARQADLSDKRENRDFLQHQMATQNERDRIRAHDEFDDKAAKDETNRRLNATHQQHLATEKQNNAIVVSTIVRTTLLQTACKLQL